MNQKTSTSAAPAKPTRAGIAHHTAAVNGTEIHYVSAGTTGSPILLIHGFPESWWAFRRLIPLLAESHRVFAVDLRGFGDSRVSENDYGSAVAAEDPHQLIAHLGAGTIMFSGDRHGQLDDAFGHRWIVSQHLREFPHDEIVAAAAKVFG